MNHRFSQGELSWIISHEEGWKEVISQLVPFYKSYDTWLLFGDMGVGKTTFVRYLGYILGTTEVSSPTFSIINEYHTSHAYISRVYHMDLYRLEGEEWYEIGLEEYWEREGLKLVEWPEIAEPIWPDRYLALYFHHTNLQERELLINFHE